jgi:hypothetical protein
MKTARKVNQKEEHIKKKNAHPWGLKRTGRKHAAGGSGYGAGSVEADEGWASGGEGRRHAGFPGEETGSNSARSLRRCAPQVHARSPHYGLLTLSPIALPGKCALKNGAADG